MASAIPARRSRIQSVERAAAVLRLLSGRRRRLGVVELAQALGLHKSTIHGILRTLLLHGFVEQDPGSGKYQLGPALPPMRLGYLEASRLRAAALNPAHALAGRTRESVRVALLCDRRVLIIHHLGPPTDGRPARTSGAQCPRARPALGKALLSQDPGVLAKLATDGLERFTPATITDPGRLRRAIARTRRSGWASEIREFSPGWASIAAPIAAGGLADAGAIGIDGPIERLCARGAVRPDLVAAVIESARAGARALGVAQ